MIIEQSAVEKMTGEELVRLARTLSISLTQRRIKRSLLIEEIMDVFKERDEANPYISEKLTTPALSIRGLQKKFGRTLAVDSLDLDVNPGEIVGLVGPNGAGKTTTLRVLTGIIKPTKGSVIVNGHDIQKAPLKAKHRLGYIPERPTCYPSLKVREYITFVARIYGIPREVSLVRLREFVDMLQLEEFLDSYIGTLSKGNLQRTLLAGIFVRDEPFILAFDEPIYGLDPRGAWSLKSYLRQLKRSNSAILVSTHILEVAEALCDRFVIMNNARVVGTGTLEELKSSNGGAGSLEEVFLLLTGGIPEGR
ncbi:MAG: ATP-binding cassette domain-containing protein [Candidatus Thorarchaeota archaeon]